MIQNKKRKIICIVASLMLSFIALITFISCYQAKKRINFKITASDGIVAVNYIRIGETQYKIKAFAERYNLNYSNNNTKENDWDDILYIDKDKSVEFSLTRFHNINIGIEKNKTKGDLLVSYNNKIKKYDFSSKNKTDGVFITNHFSKIILDYFTNITINKAVLTFFVYVVSCIILYYILRYALLVVDKVKEKKELKITDIILLFLSVLILCLLLLYPCMELIGRYIIIPIFVILCIFIYYLKDSLKNNIHSIFALLAIISTILFSLIIPPFHVPDEPAHYFKAYSILNPDKVDNKNKTLSLKSNIDNTIQKYTFDLLNGNYRTSAKEYFANFWVKQEGNKYISYNFYNTYDLKPIAYIPSAIVIKISTMLNFPFIFTLILGRLINALIFVILGFLALKKIPYFKKILFVVMLFPITIQQVSAVNQDSLTLSISFLIISQILYLIKGKFKKISLKDMVLTIILCCILGLCKPVYFPITFLLLMIPKNKFNSKKDKAIFVSIAILIPIILCSTNYGQYVTGSVNSEKKLYKMSMIITQPFTIINVVFQTILERLDLDIIRGQINGFGWSTVWYKNIGAFILPILYLLILFFDNPEESKLTKLEKIIFASVFVIIFGIVYASMLFSWTEYGSVTIDGLQSRYFIPAVLLLAIALTNNKIKTSFKNKELYTIIIVLITISYSLFTIIKGFYI